MSCCNQKPPQQSLIAVKIQLYRPLLIITAIALLGSVALYHGAYVPMMDGMMGLFLCMLAALQLFDPKGFAATLAQYDPLAKRTSIYGVVYPFIELAAGLSYLAGTQAVLTNIVVLVIFGINTIGVLQVMKSGASVRCACAGTAFNLPVGRVTLAENTAMMLMAAYGLYHLLGH